jgi:tellurite resistance protein TerC
MNPQLGTNPLVRGPSGESLGTLAMSDRFFRQAVPIGDLPLDSSFLFVEWLGTPLWMWSSFIVLVIAILSFDLGILHKQNKEIGVCESVKLSARFSRSRPIRSSPTPRTSSRSSAFAPSISRSLR